MSEIGQAIININEALCCLEKALSNIANDENPIIETMSHDLKKDLESVMDALVEFVSERDANILEDLLEENRLFRHCDILLKKCENFLPRFINYMRDKVLNAVVDRQGDLQCFSAKVNHVTMAISEVCQKIRRFMTENKTSDSSIKILLEDSMRYYARQVYKQTERDLRHEAQKFKESRNAPLTPEVWGAVLENENFAIGLAKDGILTKPPHQDDEYYEGFSDDMKKQMEESFPLMQKILDISMDDSLFDLEYGLESHVNLLSALNVHNLDVFHELILRHNIIRCGAFPSLKEKFNQWINVKPAQAEVEYNIEGLAEEARVWMLRKDIYPKLAKLLNEEVKPYIEGTKTKATWDSIHFLFKIFGIVKPRFSRKDFAILVTQIVPGLGEASALESMMEKSGMNWPPIKKFKIEEAAVSVETALRPFYDKFKNL